MNNNDSMNSNRSMPSVNFITLHSSIRASFIKECHYYKVFDHNYCELARPADTRSVEYTIYTYY